MTQNLPNPGPCPFAGFQCEGPPLGDDGVDPDNYAWYTVTPNNKFRNDCGIIYFSDGKGIWHNSRVLADQFALAGYHVVVINHRDVVRGEGLPFTEPPVGWAIPTEEALGRMLFNAVAWLEQNGCVKKGAVGYCAGGAPVLRHAALKAFHAAFVAHPTGTSQDLFRNVQIPVSVAFADNDSRINRATRNNAETGLLASGYPYQISLYSHVHHGFSCRRAFTTQAEVFAKKQSFIQAITWMEEHLREELIRERAVAVVA